MRGSTCPSLHRLSLLLQATYSHRERTVGHKIDGTLLFLAHRDVMRVHKLITRHRSLCLHCKFNEALRDVTSPETHPLSNIIPFRRAS